MNNQQKARYSRHISLKAIGEEGQQKLLDASVLVVGAGGLGAPVLQYLVAAGVGHVGCVDADVVSLSNLQRQVLYREDDIGKPKVDIAKATLSQLNDDVHITTYPVMLSADNAETILSNYDIIVGATDNFESRLIIDKLSKAQGKAFVHGSIGEFEGQVAVFNYQGGISYQDLFSSPSASEGDSLGVMGVLPGIIGSLQATEVIKIICGIGEVLSNKLMIYDALSCEMQVVKMA
ncbi:MAG: HesA/MoeB/ThiF family protein [Bacteroidales bacterium]|jgi:molybdopterin/thiamine biosynthesis adenylyltransferase|nr:HesA/MoeB/ThiF family protein [Bacteroidales bacterium]